jgi:flagellar biosynthesis repressor protein FlbT
MNKCIHLSLRSGERLFINGAVLRADRKVTLELLNNATFLLEGHVIQPEDATTPLRQLYFIVQTMLMDPAGSETSRASFEDAYSLLCQSFRNAEILAGLKTVADLLRSNRLFEALKALRALFPMEHDVLHSSAVARESQTKQPQENLAWN